MDTQVRFAAKCCSWKESDEELYSVKQALSSIKEYCSSSGSYAPSALNGSLQCVQ